MRKGIGLVVLAWGATAYAQAGERETAPAAGQVAGEKGTLAAGQGEVREKVGEIWVAKEKLAMDADAFATVQTRFEEVSKELADMAKVLVHGPERPFLGVLIAKGDEEGIHVAGVSPDGGAEEAGLRADDIIVAINGETLMGGKAPMKVLHDVLDDVEPGEGVDVVVLRNSAEMPFHVITTSFAASPGWHVSRAGHEARRFLDEGGRPFRYRFDFGRHSDLRLVDIGEDLGDYFGVDAGVLVLDTPAKSELKPGDIVKRIDGAAVSSADDAYRLLRQVEGEAEAEVRRKNRKVTVELDASLVRPSRVWLWNQHGEEEEVELKDEN